MKSQAAKVPVSVLEPSQLTHEDVDLTITALEIYATAIRDEIDDQQEPVELTEGDEALPQKSGFDYERKLVEVQEVLRKYREILKGLLTA